MNLSGLHMVLKGSISFALIWYLVTQTDVSAMSERFASMEYGWLGAALVMLLIQVAIATQRWIFVLRALQIEFPFRDALRVVFVGLFFNQTLPSTIGGDVVRIWELRRADIPLQSATTSVVLDRITALAAIVLVVTVSLPILFVIVGDAIAQVSLALGALGGLASLLVLVTMDLIPGLSKEWRMIRFVAALARDARRVLLSAPVATRALGASVIIAIISGVSVALVARSLNINVGLLECCVLFPPVLLLSALPISLAGWGVREAAMVAAFGYVEVGATDALVLSVVVGLTVVAVGLPGGLMWLCNPSTTRTS